MILLLFFIFASGARLNTAFYTYQKLGSYSITDLYINYLFSRYELNLAFEKRPNEFGFKSFSIKLDSIKGNNSLVLGEKYCHINGPISTTLPLWGISLINRNINLYLGKTKDYTTSLPPTFKQNNYTLGFNISKKLFFRMPVELNFLKRSDATGIVRDNNYLSANIRIKFADKFHMSNSFATTFSEIGIGNGITLSASYIDQRYGTNMFFRKIFKNFVTPSNYLSIPGNWFQINNYFHPLSYLSVSHNFSYSNLYDINSGLSIGINKFPIPELGYGLGFSFKNKIITQNIHTGYRYKKFSISGDYGWSVNEKSAGLKLTQEFKKLLLWSQFQIREARIYQLGYSFLPSPNIKIKTFLNLFYQNNFTRTNTGIELSLKLLRNFNVNTTYELINYDKRKEHNISFSLTNNLIFEQTGLGLITGKVFIDTNNNGIFDFEDEVVPDIEILLDGIHVTRTDKNGSYRFSFVPSGEHTLNLNLFCIPAEIGTGRRKEKINTRFLSRQKVDFALGRLGFIEGYVFYDDNKNNKFDMEEKGIPNVVLGLNGFFTTTDKNGKFRFANLLAGTYVLEAKVLPPETFLYNPDLIYIHIKPGEELKDFYIAVLRKEREIEKKTFEEPQIIQPSKQRKRPIKTEIRKIPEEEIEKLFRKGVDHFIKQRYDDALKFFEQILALDPEHKRAQEYRKRTISRIEILKRNNSTK